MSGVSEFTSGTASGSDIRTKEQKLAGKNLDNKVNNSKPPRGKKTSTLVSEKPETGRLLLEKQREERKHKTEERKKAVDERRRRKEQEDRERSDALRQILDSKGASASRTGRKLPSVPNNLLSPRCESSSTRRSSASSSSSDSVPSGPGKNAQTRRGLTGPSSVSTSSLNSLDSARNLNKPKTNLGTSKKTSTSTNDLNTKTSNGKKTVKGVDGASQKSTGVTLPKARSMNAIHQLGVKTKTSRPSAGKKSKAKPVHHAGSCTEEEARLALAEHRKKMREEAERKALLDKERQEELRKQREAEEKRLAEEKAKELARQAELAKQLEAQEAERAELLRAQREKEAEIAAEKAAAELRHKEELEILKKQELERRAREAEKREKEEEERLKQEEIERQERRKRVEMIMARTRMTATSSSGMTNSDKYSSLEDLSVKLSDECHSNTVSEILQKVKEKSRVPSPGPNKDIVLQKENQQYLENVGKESVDGKEYGKDFCYVNSRINIKNSVDSCLHSKNINRTLMDTKYTSMDNCSTLMDNGSISRYTDGFWSAPKNNSCYEGALQDVELWNNVEHCLRSTETNVRKNFERNGYFIEDDKDEDGEEGQLWKVVEGKREISEVI